MSVHALPLSPFCSPAGGCPQPTLQCPVGDLAGAYIGVGSGWGSGRVCCNCLLFLHSHLLSETAMESSQGITFITGLPLVEWA